MQKSATDAYRLKDKVRLTLRVNYISAILSIVFGIICIYPMHIYKIIPYTFFTYGAVNLINNFAYKRHENLLLTYNVTSILALACAIIITLYSGGIKSSFIFVLALIVFTGYVTTKVYGKIYLYLNLLIITLLYLQSIPDFSFAENVVPETSGNSFSFLSILFSVYLLGGVLGKNLLRAHHDLYKSRNEIAQRINEKETLLKEIHHRVKNNLQTVSSLLNLQSRNIEDANIKSLIKSSQNRVISMAMVHEMLYMREDLTKIEYGSYVKELAEYLVRSLRGQNGDVKLSLDIKDIKLDIDTAIPLGLLINEIITNSLKYGFADNRHGEIYIAIEHKNGNEYLLYIGDDGIGYSDTLEAKDTPSLGLKLIHNLARQLKGSITRDFSKKGTHYIITFKEVGEQFESVA